MPVVRRTNNRVLPNNSRNVDVARKTIREVIDVEQQKYMNAFRVEGFQAVLYTRLNSGLVCSCHGSKKQLNTRLGKDGKAEPGFINELITGHKFSIEDYGSTNITIQDLHDADDFNLISMTPSQHDGKFEVVTGGNDSSTQYIGNDPDEVGANGERGLVHLDDLVGDIDPFTMGFNDASCSVCFGTGYVGGYSPFNGVRIVRDVNSVELEATAEIDLKEVPWSVRSSFSFNTRLPKGAVGIDSMCLFNGAKIVSSKMYIDGEPTSLAHTLSKCDGREHKIFVETNEVWTHIELQFATSKEPAFFEFPRIGKSYNATMFDETEPFSIHIGPNVPIVRPQDIIRDSTYNKTLIVLSVNDWNTRAKHQLGFTCSVRVCQPMEIFTSLASRKVLEQGKTTLMVRDNMKGHRT